MKSIIRRTVGVTAALAVILSVGFAANGFASASASPSDRPAAGGPKPTVVLVHGAWADSSSWNEVITRLDRLGYPVIAPANPLRGLGSDAAYLQSVLTTIDGPIVLVGHSYGGAVITNAAVDVPNVEALVYIAGFAPDEGETLLQLSMLNPGSEIGPPTFTTRPYPLPDDDDEGNDDDQGNDLYLKQEAFRHAFAADLPERTTDRMAATQRPFAEDAFFEPSGRPAWTTIDSWFLIPTRDHAIPPATQRFMANRAGATIVEVKASHAAMMSQPEATTRLVLDAARSIRSS